MKALLRKLADWPLQLSPRGTTVFALFVVFAVSVPDYFMPSSMSFMLMYMLLAGFVGWRAGKWPAILVSGVVVISVVITRWILPQKMPQPAWIALWNSLMRFFSYSLAGWVMAELASLHRNLHKLVAERTAQWQAEADKHKATSTRLAEILERFEQVINNITEVFWLSDVAKNEMVYISPAYERIWGRKCEELYREPRSWLTAVHPDEREQIIRDAQVQQASGDYDVEYRIVRPDGAVRWIRDRAFPVRNARGEVYRIAGLAEDITESREARERLLTKEAILENMAEAVVVTDDEGIVIQVNPAAERMWRVDRSEVLGRPPRP